jgi:hypothetical protein
MVKGRPWSPATLKAVGGTQGVGITFLEETFSASTAPAEHRLHQKAARAVLAALLPDSGTDIKGHLRSHRELSEVSGYADRPDLFRDLIRILDAETRLITPTDVFAAWDAERPNTPSPGSKRSVKPSLPGELAWRLLERGHHPIWLGIKCERRLRVGA